ncbi:MAG TPA: ferrochelatase [Actinomycetota bacterium]|nr:ferrochelatase [Actinomycetota bacterium]
MTAPVGILVMAYGSPAGPGDIERYYADIRGGRPPSPEQLAELRERYAAIGDRFPLLETTRAQAAGLERALDAGEGGFRAYVGMKHSPPWIHEAVARMREDGIRRAVGLVMAPHWSALSVETYVERVERAVAAGGGPAFSFVRSWHDHPGFVSFLASRVADALDRLAAPERDGAAVVFTAHSLPVRTLPDGSLRCKGCEACPEGCTYAAQLRRTAELVAAEAGLEGFEVAWQSAGRTADPWWGPPLEEVMERLARESRRAVVVCSAGFVADHLETLYDLDLEARDLARDLGLRFERTEMPNADPAFLEALADVVRRHLAG